MSRHLFKVVLVVVVLAVLGGCVAAPVAPAPAPAANQPAATVQPSAAQEPVKLSFFSRDPNKPQIEKLVKVWNESHPAIQIEPSFVPPDNFVTKFGTMVAGGTPPDIVAVDLVYAPQFAAANQLSDITDLAKSLPYFDKLSPSHVRLATYGDKIYGLPFNAEASVLMWNKDLFKEAGLDPEKPPKTWAEVADAAKKITALGNGKYGYYFSGNCAGCNAFTFAPLIWANGGDILSADGTQATLTDPKVKEALEFYRQMWADGVIPPGAKTDGGTEFLNTFASGKIGMQGLGAFAIAAIKASNPNMNFGVAYLPGKEGGQSSFAGGDIISIPAGSKYVKEAFEFIKWLTSEETQLSLYAKEGSLPVRTDLADNQYFKADPRLTVNTQAMGLGKTPYTVKYNELINDSNGPWLQMLQTAIFDGKVDEAIATAQAKMTQILSQK
jgi:multiple sugar transport system substrate-binding protein